VRTILSGWRTTSCNHVHHMVRRAMIIGAREKQILLVIIACMVNDSLQCLLFMRTVFLGGPCPEVATQRRGDILSSNLSWHVSSGLGWPCNLQLSLASRYSSVSRVLRIVLVLTTGRPANSPHSVSALPGNVLVSSKGAAYLVSVRTSPSHQTYTVYGSTRRSERTIWTGKHTGYFRIFEGNSDRNIGSETTMS
jgi:hypothetical protein